MDNERAVPHYHYYHSGEQHDVDRSRKAAADLAIERLDPHLTNPDFLVLKGRVGIIRNVANSMGRRCLRILDVGGRIQPYRPLFDSALNHYIAIDPQIDGETDVVAWGESLPFGDATFDLILCLQVLSYVRRPDLCISECYRVLKPGGVAVVSAPAFFPEHHDELWRFLPTGLMELFSNWSKTDVYPECHSAGGALRTLNVCLNQVKPGPLQACCRRLLIPLFNAFGLFLEHHNRGGQRLCANYVAIAVR